MSHVLALEPFHGGSHRAFLEGWARHSKHRFTVLGLSAHHWKWRMRHASLTLARQVAPLCERETFDGLWCSDMLNLPEFLGLAPPELRSLPSVVYFHENQLTYPDQHRRERDHHFAFTNFLTASAARAVWFNSAFHRHEFVTALRAFLERMPDHRSLEAVEELTRRAVVQPPGIEPPTRVPERRPGPLRILWAARFEQDKNPAALFAALRLLRAKGVDFRLAVIGEQFEQQPAEFLHARQEFAGHIDTWGFQETREDYERVLGEADVVVSTALHEFFGIAMVEAAAAGAIPVLPQRLAYPEVFGLGEDKRIQDLFYDGTVPDLAHHLEGHAQTIVEKNDNRRRLQALTKARIERYTWQHRAPELDDALEEALGS